MLRNHLYILLLFIITGSYASPKPYPYKFIKPGESIVITSDDHIGTALFSPNGQELAFLSKSNGSYNVQLIDLKNLFIKKVDKTLLSASYLINMTSKRTIYKPYTNCKDTSFSEIAWSVYGKKVFMVGNYNNVNEVFYKKKGNTKLLSTGIKNVKCIEAKEPGQLYVVYKNEPSKLYSITTKNEKKVLVADFKSAIKAVQANRKKVWISTEGKVIEYEISSKKQADYKFAIGNGKAYRLKGFSFLVQSKTNQCRVFDLNNGVEHALLPGSEDGTVSLTFDRKFALFHSKVLGGLVIHRLKPKY